MIRERKNGILIRANATVAFDGIIEFDGARFRMNPRLCGEIVKVFREKHGVRVELPDGKTVRPEPVSALRNWSRKAQVIPEDDLQ